MMFRADITGLARDAQKSQNRREQKGHYLSLPLPPR
jgi:hypothetical protein